MSVATSKRHNRLVTALANFAQSRAGCLVRRELTLVVGRRLRPDLEITPLQHLEGRGFLSDVEVTRADSTSYLAKSSVEAGHAANDGAQSKILKYVDFADGVPIIPLVFEAHGRPSKLAIQAIELISKSAETLNPPLDDESSDVAFETTRSLFHVVSYHLHAGNADVVRAYLQAVKSRDPANDYAARAFLNTLKSPQIPTPVDLSLPLSPDLLA
jgi:hypothetical protein